MHRHSNGSSRDGDADIARSVRRELDSQYPLGKFCPIEELEDICDFTYTYLTDLCADHITEYFEGLADTEQVTFRRAVGLRGPVSFLFDKVVYTCRIGPSISNPRMVCVNVSKAVATDVARPVERRVDLEVNGRYRGLRVYVDDSVSRTIDSISEISHTVMTAGDRWVEAFVVAQLASLQDDPLTQLYALIRRPFSDDIGRAIRVYLVHPAHGGGVFMDEEARHDTLTRFSSYSYTSLEKAPVELLSGLLVARFGIQDTVARDIFPNMTTVIKSAMEIPSGTQVGLAQYIMYHNGGMVLQPLVALDRLWIEAAYPAPLLSRIAPILEGERDAIRDAVSKMKFGNVADGRTLSRGRRAERAHVEGRSEVIASIAGRFAGSFLSEFLN
jgi:hypothetical protein